MKEISDSFEKLTVMYYEDKTVDLHMGYYHMLTEYRIVMYAEREKEEEND